eukprot:5247094-Pleurochrysis_carterae.AAC.2
MGDASRSCRFRCRAAGADCARNAAYWLVVALLGRACCFSPIVHRAQWSEAKVLRGNGVGEGCRTRGWSTETVLDEASPVQQSVRVPRATLAAASA